MKNTLLKVNNINKSYGKIKAVDDVSFEVFSGEILGLLGPNGAGKTTIIRMIMDILEPDSGEISFLGDKLNKKKMGYLPEARGLYEETKVMDRIQFYILQI